MIATAFICVALIGVGVMMLNEYTANLEEQAGVRALLYTTDTSTKVKEALAGYEKLASNMAESIVSQNPGDEESFLAVINGLIREKRFSNLWFVRYVKDGQEYNGAGYRYDMTVEAQAIKNHLNDREVICSGVVTDHEHSLAVICFIVPIDSPFADRMLFFFSPEVVIPKAEDLNLNPDYVETSRITAICSNEGEILRILHREEGETYQQHNNIFEQLRGKINNKSVLDAIRVLIQTGSAGAYPVIIDGKENSLSVSGIGKSDTSISVIALYESQEIYSSGYSTISIVLGMLSVFLVLLLGMVLISIINYRRTNRKLLTLNDTDPRLGCPTRVKFEREGADILSRHKATNFAVVTILIKHYTYFSSQLGYDAVTELLQYLNQLYKTQLRTDEAYGYMSHGEFVMLLHYKDLSDITWRLNMIYSLAGKYTKNIPSSYRLELYGALYETNQKFTESITEMVDFANSAVEGLKQETDIGTFHRYTADIHETKTITGYIEVHQEVALQNNEFRVFYQPKYNIQGSRIDGSEALVRWYNKDKDEYATPGVFLPLFESNGFVTKLDRYVYEQVCKYISDAVKQRERVYPVSVNVSRLTAAEPDFADFYIATKRKYGIPDGFIMIEFTESIAYENYEVLRDIITKLHANGFKCSIDDFGSGFSSYSILKELQMDEIKLDRFFIKQGCYADRDQKVLMSIINLARDLKMKVTQEGVETEEQLMYLKKLGCEVIQGYYYSKPLSLADFISFMNSTKINLKLD
ncbi:MAG: EAL domain-containing protein [Lachnospiraceae bacterium]|nr:EAL domain-containing protein [Lachnospiraceae bacterium]